MTARKGRTQLEMSGYLKNSGGRATNDPKSFKSFLRRHVRCCQDSNELHPCNIPAAVGLHLCDIPAAVGLHLCDILAAVGLHLCDVLATVGLNLCNILAGFELEDRPSHKTV